MQINNHPWIIIIGGTSAIAKSLAHQWAQKNFNLIISGRDEEEINSICNDIQIRYSILCQPLKLDLLDFEQHQNFFEKCLTISNHHIKGIIFCAGFMDEQNKVQNNNSLTIQTINANFTSTASILNLFANYFETNKNGFIACISSVAGDRGRQSNYIYGAAKSGLSTYLQGLRNRMFKSGVPVLTIKPGFVDTAMTYGMEGLFLVASPDKVAKDIILAIEKKKDILYTPGFWKYIMLIIKNIPERIFKKMSL